MHKLIITMGVVVFALIFGTFGSFQEKVLACSCSLSTLAEEKSDNERLALEVEGMTCDGCAETVRSAIMDVKGVVDCHVHFPEKTVHVVVKKGTGSDRSLRAVEEAGYKARIIEKE